MLTQEISMGHFGKQIERNGVFLLFFFTVLLSFQASSSILFLERKRYWTQDCKWHPIWISSQYVISLLLSFSKFSLATRFQDHGFLVLTFFRLNFVHSPHSPWCFFFFVVCFCFFNAVWTIPLIMGCLGLGLEPLSFPCLSWQLKHSKSPWGEGDLLAILKLPEHGPFQT